MKTMAGMFLLLATVGCGADTVHDTNYDDSRATVTETLDVARTEVSSVDVWGDPERSPDAKRRSTAVEPEVLSVDTEFRPCPGWDEGSVSLACGVLQDAAPIKAERESLMWAAAVPAGSSAARIEVTFPNEPVAAASSFGIKIRLGSGPRAGLGASAAVFSLDPGFRAVDRDQVRAVEKRRLDVSGCPALSAGWSLHAYEFVSTNDAWSVVFEPVDGIPWGETREFIAVDQTPKCERVRTAVADLEQHLSAHSNQDAACAGGLR